MTELSLIFPRSMKFQAAARDGTVQGTIRTNLTRSMKKKYSVWYWVSIFSGLSLILSLAFSQSGQSRPSQPAAVAISGDAVQVLYIGFSPPSGVAEQIEKTIDQASQELLIQAYGFTHNAIAQAVVRAHQRGVKVYVLLDKKSASTNKYVISMFQEAGVLVRLDGAHAIAHNKVMVMDAQVVITGSLNFTNSGVTRNAENVLILKSESLAQVYRTNWQTHWEHSTP